MSPPDDDIDRDAWLSAALRHAPDAHARPPAAVDEAILRAARAAARPPPVAQAPGAFAALWAWLARPPVAAGFAGLMVATVLGLMWWDRPLEPALPARPPAAGASPPATPAPPPVATTPRADTPAVAPRADTTAEARFGDRHATPASPAAAARARPPAAPSRPTTPAQDAPNGGAPPNLGRAVPDAAAARDAAPAVPEANAPARADAAPATAARAAAKAAAPPAAGLPSRWREGPGNPVPGARPPALTELLVSVAAQPERWRWQRDDAVPRPITPEVQRWLRGLDEATAGRWQALGAAEPPGDAASLRLRRDGEPAIVLRLGPAGVWFAPAGAAALDRGDAEALRRSLDDATR